ncbi:MAG: copper amine oxidase N-terminal domain-containing protein, partial [Anaerotignum sp.]
FKAAYEKGEYDCFEFARKAWTESTEPFEVEFEMTLIAEPGFEGDVTLTLGGDAFEDEQEVVIAKFVAPYTVEAAQNDLIIDYRNTEVPTTVVVKEAEAGLWKKGMEFIFGIEKMEFEDDATYTVDDESGMEVKSIKNVDMGFKVDEESDDEAAVVTIDGISLYMERNIPAGAYDLKLGTSAGDAMMTTDVLFTEEHGEDCPSTAHDHDATPNYYGYKVADLADWDYVTVGGDKVWIAESSTVKEGFVNVITAGRDQDDASFTKKVVVPVGESYIVAGEETVTLDVPAYISAAGYTMLPVRAVAVALGINNNNVLWDQATKTVTILYGQRIITMSAGQKVVYVNGSAIPASASVEIKDGRTFLPMRDLATALGVTDITWDAATKTATLNGNK